MIRLIATRSIAADEFAQVDEFGDRLMDALLLSEDIVDPDLAISMTERTLELQVLIATNDAFEAVDRGNRAIQTAFLAAGHEVPASKLWMHRDLFQADVAVRTELVSA
jgi:hypothetical protein